MEQIVINGLFLGAQYALIALGLTLIFALMNVLNFAHGQMYVLGGYVTYLIYGELGLPFALGLAASAVTLLAVGAVIEKYLFRPVLQKSVREESTMLLAAGLAFFFDAVILLLFGQKQRGVPKIADGIFKIKSDAADGANAAGLYGLVFFLALLFVAGCALFLFYTETGKRWRQAAARLFGGAKHAAAGGHALCFLLAALVGVLLAAGLVGERAFLIIPNDRIIIALLAVLLIAAFVCFMQYTKPGRAMRALAQDRMAAQLMGVSADRYGMLGFALGALLAGVVGGLLVAIVGVSSGIGGPVSIKAFLMVMIGGAGVVPGAIVGGFILGMLESVGLSTLRQYGDITYLVIFAALMVFLSLRPNGLMGKPWG